MVLVLLFFLPIGIFAQQILLLERPGTVKNYKYNTGDDITFTRYGDPASISGPISRITDSTIVVDYLHQIKIKDIEKVYRTRWGWQLLHRLSALAGGGYFVISTANNLINRTFPIVGKDVFLVSGTSLAIVLLTEPLKIKTCKMNKGWRLRVLNFSAIEIK